MSFVCTMEKCKKVKGPCNCEKVMSVLLALAVCVGLYSRFAR